MTGINDAASRQTDAPVGAAATSAKVLRRFEGKPLIVTALGAQPTLQFTVLQGYGRVVGIMFDPDLRFLLSLVSNRTQIDLLPGVITSIGNYGWIPLTNSGLELDTLNLTPYFLGLRVLPTPQIALNPGGGGADVLTPAPYVVPFPFTTSFTLAYEK